MVLCLGEPPRRFLMYLYFAVDVLHFIYLYCCHLSIFFIHILLFDIIPHPSVDYCQVFTPILYFQPNYSVIFLSRALRFWVDVFYLTLLYRHWLNLRLSRFPWEPAVLRWTGLHTDPRNTDPAHLFVWFTVIHKLHVQNDSLLNSTIWGQSLLVVKSLVV